MKDGMIVNSKYEIYNVESKIYECGEMYPNTFGLVLMWDADIGFGEINLFYDREKDEWEIDSEYMGKDFCLDVFNKWLESINELDNYKNNRAREKADV